MRNLNFNSEEQNKEMMDFMNIDLKDAISNGNHKKVDMNISSGTIVLSNLWNTGPTYHHVINQTFPKGIYPAYIFFGDIQAILIDFAPEKLDALCLLSQRNMSQFEGDIMCFDANKLNPDLVTIEFRVNGTAISLMDVYSMKEYKAKKKQNPKDVQIAKVDTFVNTSLTEDFVKLSPKHNCILTKPYLGKGIYFEWVGMDLEDEIKFFLVDLHIKYTEVK